MKTFALLALSAMALGAPTNRRDIADAMGTLLNGVGSAAKDLFASGSKAKDASGAPVNTDTAPYSVLFAPAAPKDATDAFSNFANHVYGVSASLLGLSTAIGPEQIKALARIGYAHEVLEAIEAGKMESEASTANSPALQALIKNTPCVNNGFKLAELDPTPQNALYVAQQICIVRDALILPNILEMGKLSGAKNLIVFTPVGPMLGQGAVAVQQPGSELVLAAQKALGCSE
ncbi:hypothetical protein CcCBS67573_g05236 [Chytriomyces confervae]|uniref:Uncharacterized protein n=1 Tax=Chytriomyces confervae TaxID=246404 RepID=A0A507FDY6_9FUNG|nr:hypothetical protein HDU80_010327 [Chytriomyces hyalinus]TPX73488.1 hypothetical protein CcCBS67573_g05236 [Chytriomyces confervae]